MLQGRAFLIVLAVVGSAAAVPLAPSPAPLVLLAAGAPSPLALWTTLAAPAAPMAALAEAALAAADASPADPAAALDALAPLLAAQAGAAALAGLALPAEPPGLAAARAALGASAATAVPAVPHFASLPDAVAALLARHGALGTPEGDAALAALAGVPASEARPLAALLALHLFQAEAAAQALAGPVPDLALLAAMQAVLEREVPGLAAQVDAALPVSVEVCGVLLIDLTHTAAPHGCDAAFAFDVGGDDAWTNNAGGATGGAALLVDRNGRDTYVAARGVGGLAGGGYLGAGALFDLAGDDTYDAAVGLGGVVGGAFQGAGLLVDLAGRDVYVGRADFGGAVGGAFQGLGVLGDAEGDDRYDAAVGFGGAIGGAHLGAGVLRDGAGSDAYLAVGGTLAGLVGGGVQGAGVLIDAGAGDDVYEASADTGALNGAGLAGVGVLADEGGTNAFAATLRVRGAANGGAEGAASPAADAVHPGGVGILLAGPGDDTFSSNGVGQGAARLAGVGLLVDAGGANDYTAGPGGLAQGAGMSAGVGILVDHGERASFTLLDGAVGQGSGKQGVGLLLRTNSAGSTAYSAEQSAASSTLSGLGVGLRLDFGIMDDLPLLSCTGSPELVRFSLATNLRQATGDLQAEFRLCSFDRSTTQRLSDALPPQLPKPGLECDRLGPVPLPDLCTGDLDGAAPGLDWPALVEQTLGPGANAWLARDTVDTTMSGGAVMLYGRETRELAAVLQGKFVTIEGDRVCEAGCRALTGAD